jgi:hypothetical protein
MKMTAEEKVFLDKIVADSGLPLDTVRQVLRAILFCFMKELYSAYGNSEDKQEIKFTFYIPYTLKLLISLTPVFSLSKGEEILKNFDTKSSLILEKEIERVFKDMTLQIEDDLKKDICLNLIKKLEIDKDVIIDDSTGE